MGWDGMEGMGGWRREEGTMDLMSGSSPTSRVGAGVGHKRGNDTRADTGGVGVGGGRVVLLGRF